MTALPRNVCVAALAGFVFLACSGTAREDSNSAQAIEGNGEVARVAIQQNLQPMEGSRLSVSLVEVTYQPGGFSTPHRHRCPVVGYVTAGSLQFQAGETQEVIYRAGDSFYEAAGERHTVSANASDSAPVTFLAYFICDDDGPRTVAAGDSGERGGE